MAEQADASFSRPDGPEGLDRLREMNEHHRALSEWGLSKLPEMTPSTILDIGCGGGMFVSLLSERFLGADITGIDHSDEAIRYSAEYNAELITKGRCDFRVASVSDLPFDDERFDLVTAVETYFFWPDLRNDIREVARVVSKGGTLMILAESYPHPDFTEQNERYRELYGVRLIDNDSMVDLLESNGFSVTVETLVENNWVVFVARKDH